jgi:hypothetical protein
MKFTGHSRVTGTFSSFNIAERYLSRWEGGNGFKSHVTSWTGRSNAVINASATDDKQSQIMGSDSSLLLNCNDHHLSLPPSTSSFDSQQTGISVLVYGFLISSRHLCRVCYWPASRCTPAVDETRVYYQFTRKSLFLACNLPTFQLSVWSRINPCISLTHYPRLACPIPLFTIRLLYSHVLPLALSAKKPFSDPLPSE